MAEAKPKYKKSLCAMCPVRLDCLSIKMGVPCGQCQHALMCASKGGLLQYTDAQMTCRYIKGKWVGVGADCLVITRLLRERAELEGAFGTKHTPLCPRCEVVEGALRVNHRFLLPSERSHPRRPRATDYIFRCTNCSVDVTLTIK